MLQFKNWSKFLNSGETRTRNIKKNIFASVFLRGVSILTTLLLIPVTINYVNPTQYGIWLTLSSIIGWIAYFDLGLCLGFKNRFAESLAKKELLMAKRYVSTTYFLMAAIFIPLGLILLIVNQYLDWSTILNLDASYLFELRKVFNVLIIFFCFQMIMKVTTTMIDADQKPALSSFITTSGQVLTLLTIYILTKITSGSLYKLSFVYSGLPVILLFICAIIIFHSNRYKQFMPSKEYIYPSLTKDILSLGGKFFIITISMLVIYQFINIILTRNLGPEAVTEYNISFRYFNVLHMTSVIILNPFWAAFTDAYTKGDTAWMDKSLKTLEKMWVMIIPIIFIMFLIAPYVFKIWIGDSVKVSSSTIFFAALYVLVSTFGELYMYLINGTGKVRIQSIVYFCAAIVSIPLMNIFCIRYGVGGVLIVPTVTCFALAVLSRVQLKKLIKGKAKGIWNK